MLPKKESLNFQAFVFLLSEQSTQVWNMNCSRDMQLLNSILQAQAADRVRGLMFMVFVHCCIVCLQDVCRLMHQVVCRTTVFVNLMR